MREFFKTELARLHLTCGLQQYFKMSKEEVKDLLDLLCAKCAHFPLIPDKDKQEYIREFMMTDSEFLGFNPKILHKWLNVVNRGYIVGQSDYKETKTIAPPYADYVKSCEAAGLPPVSEEDYDKPINGQMVNEVLQHMKSTLGTTDIAEDVAKNRANWVEEQQRKFGVPKEKLKEIQEERYQRLWKQDCFNPDGTEKDSYLPFEQWKELRFDVKDKKELSQGVSKFSEADLTPIPLQEEGGQQPQK